MPDRRATILPSWGGPPWWTRLLGLPVAALVVAGLASGCDANDPFDIEFIANVDTTAIFSLSRPELDLPGGFDLVRRQTVRLHVPGATDRWDFALDTRDGSLVLLTPGALGISNTSGIAIVEGRAFDEVVEAPGDSAAYTFDGPVPVDPDVVYVVQTREVAGTFGIPCVRYAKLGPVEVLAAEGILRFAFDVNPRCDDRRLKGDEPDG